MQSSDILQRRFSAARFFGGIATIIITCGVIAGCTYSAGHGIYFLVIGFPMFGVALGLMAKPWRYVCVQCNAPVKPLAETVPFDLSALSHAQHVAATGDAAMLDSMIRQAPLAARPSFCAIGASACKRCGQAGYLQLTTYTVPNNRNHFVAEKAITEFGAHVRGNVLSMVSQGGAYRWQHVAATSGIQLPFAMRQPRS